MESGLYSKSWEQRERVDLLGWRRAAGIVFLWNVLKCFSVFEVYSFGSFSARASSAFSLYALNNYRSTDRSYTLRQISFDLTLGLSFYRGYFFFAAGKPSSSLLD